MLRRCALSLSDKFCLFSRMSLGRRQWKPKSRHLMSEWCTASLALDRCRMPKNSSFRSSTLIELCDEIVASIASVRRGASVCPRNLVVDNASEWSWRAGWAEDIVHTEFCEWSLARVAIWCQARAGAICCLIRTRFLNDVPVFSLIHRIASFVAASGAVEDARTGSLRGRSIASNTEHRILVIALWRFASLKAK